jgi:hypothetical protein
MPATMVTYLRTMHQSERAPSVTRTMTFYQMDAVTVRSV